MRTYRIELVELLCTGIKVPPVQIGEFEIEACDAFSAASMAQHRAMNAGFKYVGVGSVELIEGGLNDA